MKLQLDGRRARGVWLVVILGILVACALPSADSSERATDSAPQQTQRPAGPTSVAGSTAAPPAESAPASWRFPGEDATAFRTFRSHMRYTVALPDAGKQYTLMDMQTEVVTGQAEHMVISQLEGETQVEIILIGDKTWLRSAGSPWMMMTSDQIAQTIASPNDFMQYWGDAEDWQYAGAEQADGKVVRHYTLEVSAPLSQVNADDWFYSAAANVSALQGASFSVETAQADAYVLDDGTLVKIFYVISGKARLTDGSDQRVEVHGAYEITDVDTEIQITPPVEAADLAEAPFPLPENAGVAGGMPGVQVFTVPDTTVDDVLAFLEAHLSEAGFTMSSKMGNAASGYMLTVEGNGAKYAVTVSPADGDVTISIMGGD